MSEFIEYDYLDSEMSKWKSPLAASACGLFKSFVLSHILRIACKYSA